MVSMKKHSIDKPSLIFSQDNDIQITDNIFTQEPANIQELATLETRHKNNGKSFTEQFYLNPPKDSEDSPFLIVRSLKHEDGTQKGHELMPGEVFKLGKISYQVLECKYSDYNIKSVMDQQLQILPQNNEFDSNQKKICRICLSEEDDREIRENDEFTCINPCECKGSMQFVHVSCLKKWIFSKIQGKCHENCIHYKMKQLQCEICKMPFSQRVQYQEKIFNLFDIERPANCPYIILQENLPDSNQPNGIFLVQFSKEGIIKMGRGAQCNIRISDISVSRIHALLSFTNGKFFILDNNSKFGTLSQFNKPLEITQNKIAIQYKRTVFIFQLKQNLPFPFQSVTKEMQELNLETKNKTENYIEY